MLKNELSLPGISNARELGGYPAGNRYIKSGVLIRSGSLSDASPEAIQILREKYKLRHIVDFRMKSRTASAPDPEITGAVNTSLPVMETEDFLSSLDDTGIAEKFFAGSLSMETVYKIAFQKGLLGPEMYIGFLLGERGKMAYREFFRILAEHDPEKGAVLWHCDDGKDRAGIAAMLLLSVLGADRTVIIDDYLLTNEGNAKKIEAAKQKYVDKGMSESELKAIIFVSGGVFAEYMDNAIDTLTRKYGSVTGYIREELGLSDPDILLLREKYTQA